MTRFRLSRFLPSRPTSLRRRLILGITALATVAVLASQAIGVVVLRSWLMDRVDQQLKDFKPPSRAFLDAASKAGFPDLPKPSGALPSDFRVYFYNSDGRFMHRSLGGGDRPGARLPSTLTGLGLRNGEPVSVPATSGDGRWRALLQPGPGRMNGVVALPLDTVDGAASKILWLNVILLACTVAGLVAVARWVVRLGLLPLTRMEHTAQAITAGDLDRRLPDTDPRTEIGRLGRVLNTMLARLQRAMKEQEASEARLRRFVADAGHELRTPLTSIQGYAELALRHEQRPADEQREANRMIAQNADRMRLLVDDLQLLATLDEEPTYRSEAVDLLSVAADAVSASAVHSPSHPVDLGPLRSPTDRGGAEELELVETTGDGHRLRQVVTNLLSNAVTHTPPGTRVHVRVGTALAGPRTGGTDRPGRTSPSPALPRGSAICAIEVADEGPGLTPEEADQVFERFYRADPSRSRAHGGSGLGLAIAAAIAQSHGGRLELDTRPGHGCTFRLVLPASPSGEDAP